MSRWSDVARIAVFLSVLFVFGLLLAGPQAALASGADTQSDSASHEVAVPGEPGHGDAAHGGVSEKKFWDFIWRVMNFGVLAAVLFFVLRKPIARFFSGRREEIAHSLQAFETKRLEAEAKFKELEARLADLTADREKIIAEYIKDGEDEREKIIAHAHEMAGRIKGQAEVTINQEIKAAKAELVREIADMSSGMAEDLIKKNINDQDQERLVEEYLGKVVQN